MSKHSHISAIFDNAFQSRAGSPDVYMSMVVYGEYTACICGVEVLRMVTFRPIDSDYFVNKHSRIVRTVQRDYHPLVLVNVRGDYHPSSMALLGDYHP